MSYPSSIDAPGGTASQGTSLLTSPDHAQDHRVLGSAVISIENKLGLGVGSAAQNQLLFGQGTGTTVWGSVGTALTFVNSTLSNGTIGTSTIQSPTIIVGSDVTGDLYYRNSGGSVSRLASPAKGQLLSSGGIGTAPAWTAGTTISGLLQQFVQNTTLVNSSAGTTDTIAFAGTINLSQIANVLVMINMAWYNTGTIANFGDVYLNGTVQSGTQLLNSDNAVSSRAAQAAAQFMIGSVGVGLGTITVQFRSGATGNAAINQGCLTITAYNV